MKTNIHTQTPHTNQKAKRRRLRLRLLMHMRNENHSKKNSYIATANGMFKFITFFVADHFVAPIAREPKKNTNEMTNTSFQGR